MTDFSVFERIVFMFDSKRLGRLTACVLLVCALVSLLPAQAAAVPETRSEAVAQVSQSGVKVSYVHYSASYHATIIGCLEEGTKLNVLSETWDFYRIDCFDMKGFIAKSQVHKNENGEYIVKCVDGSDETSSMSTFSTQDTLNLKSQLKSLSLELLGIRYASGGTSRYGFDCCGLTQYIYNNNGFSISRTVASQLQDGVIVSKDDLQCGDLIFFSNTTGWGHFASHVGMYIGNGKIIHAGDAGVGIGDLNDRYFTYHYLCARRVILSDVTPDTVIPSIGINQNINSSYWREDSQTDNGLGNSFAILIASM